MMLLMLFLCLFAFGNRFFCARVVCEFTGFAFLWPLMLVCVFGSISEAVILFLFGFLPLVMLDYLVLSEGWCRLLCVEFLVVHR